MAFLPTVPPRGTTNAPTRFSTPRIDLSSSQGLSEVYDGFEVNSRSCSAVGGIFSQPVVRPTTSCLLPSSSYKRHARTLASQNALSRNSGKSNAAVGSSSGGGGGGVAFQTLPFSAVNKSFGGILFSDVEDKEGSDRWVNGKALHETQESGLVLPRWLPREEESFWNKRVGFEQSSFDKTLSLSWKRASMPLSVLDIDNETKAYIAEKDEREDSSKSAWEHPKWGVDVSGTTGTFCINRYAVQGLKICSKRVFDMYHLPQVRPRVGIVSVTVQVLLMFPLTTGKLEIGIIRWILC